MQAGYAGRMMLEISPESTFGVLAPAFRGCEKFFALQMYSRGGCTFLENQLCLLHGTGFQPLECRYCHHTRPGLGVKCHADIEKDWNTTAGQKLVVAWMKKVGLWKLRHLCRVKWTDAVDC